MIGTLTQAYTMLEWNGETLHAYDVGGTVENIAQNVSVKLVKSEAAPTASFRITPNPAGFELFQKLKASALDKPFTISYGYMSGSVMGPMQFKFSGVQLTTGHEPMLEISGTSVVKGAWTDNKISFTMEEEIPLSGYPDLLIEKCGEGCKDLSFSFVGEAATIAPTIMIKGNQMQRTPQNILADVIRPHGMQIQVSDNAFAGEMIIGYAPGKEGELMMDKPELATGAGTSAPLTRKVYVVGPGLMTNIKRTQKFNPGSTTTAGASNADNPNVPQVASAPVVQPQDPAPQTLTVESRNEAGGTTGQSNEGSGNSGSVTPAGAQGNEASAALAKMFTSSISFQVLMVPYMVGIKPRDLIAIPSLAGPGSYIEDWEVKTVSYKQDDTGGVFISITGERPYTGEEPMLDGSTLGKVQAAVSSLTTPAAWNKFYWIQGPENDTLPLSS